MFKKSEVELTNYSLDLYRKKDYKKAEKICRKILAKNPNNDTVLINLGNILFVQKKYQEALDFYKQAKLIKPDSFLALVNIANVYLEQEDYKLAEQTSREALVLDSQNYMAQNILGTALLEQEQYGEALPILQQALSSNKNDAWLYNYLSRCYQQLGMIKEAIESGWQALKLSPFDESHHINFGYMLYELSLDSKAEIIPKYASLWLDQFPENKIAEHMGKAILNQSIPEVANAEYIKEIFDIFAADFDKVLTDLNYQTPQIISRILQEIYGLDSQKKLHILDAGCGTGLCGKFLKPYARFFGLDGVDLSQGMLQEAQKKRMYNRLFCQDILSLLNEKRNSYDLIVSADVLTYFGNLDSLFSSIKKTLKKGGRFVFSITSNDENENDYILHKSGRYKHHLRYVVSLLKKNGFDIEKEEYCSLRKEALQDVKGYVISAISA